jgi:hypothetical protein
MFCANSRECIVGSDGAGTSVGHARTFGSERNRAFVRPVVYEIVTDQDVMRLSADWLARLIRPA